MFVNMHSCLSIFFIRRYKKGLDCFPEDILIEILSRLPVRTLSRVRCTSKTLNHLISQNSFLLMQAQNSTRDVLGLLYLSDRFGENIINYLPLETNVAQEFPQISWKREMKIAASCNGLLLCFRLFDDDHLYLYNPTTKKKLTLQRPPPIHYCSRMGLAVDLVKSPHSWKVVLCIYHPTIRFNVCSSEMPEWRESRGTIACDQSKLVGSIGPVYFNGAIHWVTHESNLITFHVEKESARTMKLPVKICSSRLCKICSSRLCTNVWLGSIDGRMNLVEVLLQEAVVVFWVLQDYENVTWKKKCSIGMSMSMFPVLQQDNDSVTRKNKCSLGVMPVPIFCNGNLIVLAVEEEFFSYNFKTSSWKNIGRMKCWMDWPRRYFPFISNTVGRDLQGFY